MKSYSRWGVVTGSLLMAMYATGAAAQTVTIGSAQGQAGDTVAIPVTFQQGAGAAAGYQTIFSYDVAAFGVPVVQGGSGPATCSVNDATGEISVIRFTLPATVLADETACVIDFPIEAATALGIYPLTHNAGQPQYSDVGAVQLPATGVDGQVEVVDAPPDVNLTYTPASGGTVTFPGGTSGTSTDASIAVGATGTSGSGSVTGCTLGGANPGAFVDNTTYPVTVSVGGSGSIDLTCNLGNSAATATLSCTESDTSPTAQSFNLSCPAGTAVPAPEYDSTPAPGATINCSGTPGSTQNRTLTISNVGFAGAGSDLTYTCSTASAGFSVTSGAGGTVVVGGSADVGIACTVPAEGAPAANGVLTCTSNDADEATVTYNLTAAPQTAPEANPAPAIIPANSLWSKLALFGLLAGLGGLVISMRRH